MASWKSTFLYKQWVFHFHVSESECTYIIVHNINKYQHLAAVLFGLRERKIDEHRSKRVVREGVRESFCFSSRDL